jgi:hypothetical protein
MEFSREAIKPKLDVLAKANILIATSSWKYEGWLGQLYTPERYEFRGKVAKTRFEAGCSKPRSRSCSMSSGPIARKSSISGPPSSLIR